MTIAELFWDDASHEAVRAYCRPGQHSFFRMREEIRAFSIAPLGTCVAPVSINTTDATMIGVGALFLATQAHFMDIVVVHAGRDGVACRIAYKSCFALD